MSLALRLNGQQIQSTFEIISQHTRDVVGTLNRALDTGDLAVLTSGTIFPKTAKELLRRDAVRESLVSDAIRKTVEQIDTPSVAALFALPEFRPQQIEEGPAKDNLDLQNKISAALVNGATEMTPEMRADIIRCRDGLIAQIKVNAKKDQEAVALVEAAQGREMDPFETTMMLLSVNMLRGVSEMWADFHGVTPVIYPPVSDADIEEAVAFVRSQEAVMAEVLEDIKADLPQDDALGM